MAEDRQRARRVREAEMAMLQVELERRIALPTDKWVRVDSVEDLTAGARRYLDSLDIPE